MIHINKLLKVYIDKKNNANQIYSTNILDIKCKVKVSKLEIRYLISENQLQLNVPTIVNKKIKLSL